ncbi:thermonuclease family protein [Rhizobium lentis]|uniref:thermonuclease family protein n=1 Tax=Rhizobium lentis TaxID=1138194 RepID=UPI001C82F679|nr:thermonuclease family protein [Rhizobium lentis]MBX5009367.1 thermonuclease family protein [Rhizobium lentis]MBX5085649.1 thermonuclease family protein [Rhizobium lentis]MBX5098833.1 thermonuclease family protein [Rhizobium lentis]MBX5123122.1 thermonuclease family protein [Rhizobium lentis]MBX5125638.1 thermonuclease family protein [Rhizobium lentis]
MTRVLRVIRDGVIAFALLTLLALVAAKVNDSATTKHAGAFHAADGDSLTLGEERFRLEGIDAPELNQRCERGGKAWACGQAAREALQEMVLASGTLCRGGRRDRYDRLLVVCRSGTGGDINAAMVRRGMAISYGGYGKEEIEARGAKVGLWAGTFERPRDVRDHARHNSGFDEALRFIGRIVGWE